MRVTENDRKLAGNREEFYPENPGSKDKHGDPMLYWKKWCDTTKGLEAVDDTEYTLNQDFDGIQ